MEASNSSHVLIFPLRQNGQRLSALDRILQPLASMSLSVLVDSSEFCNHHGYKSDTWAMHHKLGWCDVNFEGFISGTLFRACSILPDHLPEVPISWDEIWVGHSIVHFPLNIIHQNSLEKQYQWRWEAKSPGVLGPLIHQRLFYCKTINQVNVIGYDVRRLVFKFETIQWADWSIREKHCSDVRSRDIQL